jgi:hypothetical protein
MDSKAIGRAEVELVLQKAVKKVERLHDFELVPFESNVGVNGDHCTLKVHFSGEEENEEKELTFFVKFVPEREFNKRFVLDRGMFAKEEEMYFKILPMMAQALGRRLPAAECYHTSEDKYVILEDLRRIDFQLVDKLDVLQLDKCKAALKAIAMLHAGSLAIEVKSGKLMPYHTDHCYEALIADINSNDIYLF